MFSSPKELIEHSGHMASLPEVFHRINEAVDDPESSFAEIGHIISQDSALSARLLKIVNSPFDGFQKKIETITHAITIIGMAQLRDMVLATLVVDKFKGLEGKGIDMKGFWLHSVACGLVARIIATFSHQAGVERYYVLGLIHDIGRLIMCLAIPEKMNEAIKKAKSEERHLFEVENEMFGFDHSDVGHLLIKTWQLPAFLQEAVRVCHKLDCEKDITVDAAILHVSDIVIHSLELGTTGEPFVPRLNPDAWERISISSSMIPLIVKQLDRELDNTIMVFS